MKQLFFTLCTALIWQTALLGQTEVQSPFYRVQQDLTALRDDHLPIHIRVAAVGQDTVEFHMPRIIPGTYDVSNYGRFVHDFLALNAAGDTLPVRRLDVNRWEIAQARTLKHMHYRVADTYDHSTMNDIFEPAGTSHDSGQVYLLNNFGYIGYLQGYQDRPYQLEIRKPTGFYGATALQGDLNDSLDRFLIANYFEVHDNPILYSRPDTAWHKVGGADVLVSVYSPNGLINAKKSMEVISRVLDATADYLGGNLPVEKYAVLLYTVDLRNAGSRFGALEHHKSTVLYLPEFGSSEFYSSVRDVTAHEFFHIITPLRIHSEYVADFDFINPRMSRHIWLYEGVTEYNSHLAQIRDSIYDLDAFVKVMQEKMRNADKYNKHVPLTTAARYTLSFHKDQYLNFYQKGALAAMALDLKLIELSKGDYRLLDLLQEMGKRYGTDTFFVDDQLFDILAEVSGQPALKEFLVRHLAGTEPLPFEELLALVGIRYQEESVRRQITLGEVGFSYNFATERLIISNLKEMNAFGEAMDYQEGDELISINGEAVNLNNIKEVSAAFRANTEAGDRVKMKIARPEADGDYDKKTLRARAMLMPKTTRHVWEINETPSAEEARLRAVWLAH